MQQLRNTTVGFASTRVGYFQRRKYAASASVTGDCVLLRDYIAAALSHKDVGYFARFGPDVVHAPRGYIDFASMRGRSEYERRLHALYTESPKGWLTPSTIFAPWYARAIAAYVLRSWQHASRARGTAPSRLAVYELGGGTGVTAVNFCDYVREAAPRAYAALSYTIVEVSPALRTMQESVLRERGHTAVARAVHANAMDLRGGGISNLAPCFVLALEVLDNLPQDKAVLLRNANGEASWYETVVSLQPTREVVAADGRPVRRESYRPLHDALLSRTLDFVVDRSSGALLPRRSVTSALRHAVASTGWLGDLIQRVKDRIPLLRSNTKGVTLPPPPQDFVAAAYVPTGFAAVLESIAQDLPAAELVIADFDELPPPRVDEARAAREDAHVECYAPAYSATQPIVAGKYDGRSVDYATPLSPSVFGSVDIFFPTDFDASVAMVAATLRSGTNSDSNGSGRRSVSHQLTPSGVEQRALSQRSFTSAAASESSVLLAGAGPRHVVSAEFLREFGETARTMTRTGFNPMLEDFRNTRFLLT